MRLITGYLNAPGIARMRELSAEHQRDVDETHSKACGFGFDQTEYRIVLAEATDSAQYKVLLSHPRWCIFESTTIPNIVECASVRMYRDVHIYPFNSINLLLYLHESLIGMFSHPLDEIPCFVALTTAGGEFRASYFNADHGGIAYVHFRVAYRLYRTVCDSDDLFAPYRRERGDDTWLGDHRFPGEPFIGFDDVEPEPMYAFVGFQGHAGMLRDIHQNDNYDVFLRAICESAWKIPAPLNSADVKLRIAVGDITLLLPRHRSKWRGVGHSKDYDYYSPPGNWVEMITGPMKLAIL